MPDVDSLVEHARTLLRAALTVTLAGWVLDVLGSFGRYYYTEQFLALAAGLSCTLVLVEPPAGAGARLRALNAFFAAVVLGLFVYVAVHYPSLQLTLVLAPPHAVALGLLMIAGILEAVRRRTGPFLPALALLLAALAFVGPYLPDRFETRPITVSRLVVYLALDTNALFSKVLAIAAIVVAPFIVFGVLLNGFGGAALFSRLATRLVGDLTGGPAKVSVVGSGAFGMISGSAVANVAAVGSVSIPMMERAGYARHVAAAIEAIASTGGQLVPPIMGASAFLMAELLELPYRDVALAAVVPAALFYLALLLAVDFEARRLGLAGGRRPAADAPRGERAAWRYLVPVGVLVHLLFIEGRTAAYAGLVSTASLVAVHLAWPLHGFRQRVSGTVGALLRSMSAIADIVMLAAAAGLIIGVLNVTGVSFAITLQMLALSAGEPFVLLVLTALLSILLGLGMPTVGVYVLLATLVAPALVEVGIAPIAAHLFVLYFGMISMITPPVAIASFAAASVAGADPWRTSFASLRLGAGVYLIPFAFVTQPALLFAGGVEELVVAFARVLVAVTLAAAVTTGHLARPLHVITRGSGGVLALLNIVPLGARIPDPVLWGALVAGALLIGTHAGRVSARVGP